MDALVIAVDDPAAPDVRALLDRHLEFARRNSPPEDVHALDSHGLSEENVTFFSARDDGILLGVGALRQLDADHAEIKSMHTAEDARGRGVGERCSTTCWRSPARVAAAGSASKQER